MEEPHQDLQCSTYHQDLRKKTPTWSLNQEASKKVTLPQAIIMSSTAKQAGTTAYEAIQATQITRVHGRPTQSNYEALKSNASALTSKVEDITYAGSKSGTDDYGLLSNILGVDNTTNLLASPPMRSLRNPHCTTRCPHTNINARRRIGTSSAPRGSSGKVSSEGLAITYMMPLTNSTIPS